MAVKIILITTSFLHKYYEEAFKRISPTVEWEIHEYEHFSNIGEVYTALEEQADGLLITGNVAVNAIIKSVDELKKPLRTVEMDLANLYKIVLNLKIENKELDLNRIVLDFLLPLKTDYSLMDIVRNPSPNDQLRDMFNQWYEHSPMEDLISLESDIISTIEGLWNDRKIELVLCVYSSIVPVLEAKGIPCRYIFPSDDKIVMATADLVNKIKINQLSENLSLVISISPVSARKGKVSDWEMISLHKALLDFKQQEVSDMLIQQEKDGMTVMMSLKQSRRIEMGYSGIIENYLAKVLDFKTDIGYGIEKSIILANNNALRAKKESVIYEKSFMIDENNRLIGPLLTDHEITVSQDITSEIKEIARQAHLSTLTIQKLISIRKLTGTKEITSQEIAGHLNMTIRNANRILANLEQSNLAHIIYEKSTNSKGRPVKVYELTF